MGDFMKTEISEIYFINLLMYIFIYLKNFEVCYISFFRLVKLSIIRIKR